MQSVTLKPGHSFDTRTPPNLKGFFTINTTAGVGFEAHMGDCTAKRSGTKLMVRDILAPTTLHIGPEVGANFPPQTTLSVTFTIIGDSRDSDIVIHLPAFDVSSLATFPVVTLVPDPDSGTVHLRVADQSVDEPLSALAAGVRSALRASMGVDSLPAASRTDLTVIVDSSASMGRSTSPDALRAMCAYAAGVASVIAQSRSITLGTSSGLLPGRGHGPDDIAQLADTLPAAAHAGFHLSAHDIDPTAALILISDDIPATMVKFPGTMHLLSVQAPHVPSHASVTLFTPHLIDAVLHTRIGELARPIDDTILAISRKDFA